MINFKKLQIAIKDYDTLREEVIKKSRDVLKLSKQVIYSVHRNELKQATTLINCMEKEKKSLELLAKKKKKLQMGYSADVGNLSYNHPVKSPMIRR